MFKKILYLLIFLLGLTSCNQQNSIQETHSDAIVSNESTQLSLIRGIAIDPPIIKILIQDHEGLSVTAWFDSQNTSYEEGFTDEVILNEDENNHHWPIQWTIDDASIASINSEGILTGHFVGETLVHASVGSFSSEARIIVEQNTQTSGSSQDNFTNQNTTISPRDHETVNPSINNSSPPTTISQNTNQNVSPTETSQNFNNNPVYETTSQNQNNSQCQVTTCFRSHKNCGIILDGCGGTIQCGTCPSTEACGIGGTANVCAPIPSFTSPPSSTSEETSMSAPPTTRPPDPITPPRDTESPTPRVTETDPSSYESRFFNDGVDQITSYYRGLGGSTNLRDISGPPHGIGGSGGNDDDVLSFGQNGEITIELRDYLPFDGVGPDFIIFENAFYFPRAPRTFSEIAEISVSDDGVTFTPFPCLRMSPYTGCAGINPVFSNPSNGISPLNPLIAGGDAFDLSILGLQRIRFIRIHDLNRGDPALATRDDGFDLDAIVVLHGTTNTGPLR